MHNKTHTIIEANIIIIIVYYLYIPVQDQLLDPAPNPYTPACLPSLLLPVAQ